jgi:glyoxylase-like metal-dependent hydrolase (beta-lactamase superfamily II)
MEEKTFGQRINSSLHEIYLGRVKAFLLEASDGSLILIDTGLPNSQRNIISYVNSIGKSIRDIKYILITHAHIDHFGSAADIKKMSNAMLGINEKGIRFIDGSGGVQMPNTKSLKSTKNKVMFLFMRWMMKMGAMKPKYVKPDMILKEGVFPEQMHINAKILETPGHTPDSISVYLPDSKTIIVGDLLWGNPDKLVIHPLNDDYLASLNSVKKIRELNPDLICVSHGKNHNVSDLSA